MPTSKKILITCSRLNLPGGIERMIASLANLLEQKQHHVTLLVLDKTGDSFYPTNTAVNIQTLPLNFGIGAEGNFIARKLAFASHVKQLNHWLKNHSPEIIIATEYSHAVAMVLTRTTRRCPVYFWEHHEQSWLQKSFAWQKLFAFTLPRLSGVICLNKTEASHYSKKSRTFIIPNFSENNSGLKVKGDNKLILSAGWLIRRKGIDFIMQAAKMVLNKHKDWQWKIIGYGPMKDELLSFIESENLQDRLILQLPVSHNLTTEYMQASIFVLASRLEVFGLVLTEAMSYGIPCISFDCPSGPANIIRHQEDGLLVEKENPIKLAEAISTLIEDDQRRKKMGENAFENVKQFSPEAIYPMWEKLIALPLNQKT